MIFGRFLFPGKDAHFRNFFGKHLSKIFLKDLPMKILGRFRRFDEHGRELLSGLERARHKKARKIGLLTEKLTIKCANVIMLSHP